MTALGPTSGRRGSATPPAGTRRKRTCVTNEKLAANSLYYSCRFALDHSRVVEIVLDRLAGKGGRGYQRHALRRAKPVPRPLRDDSHHSRAERERLRTVLARDVQRRHAVEDVDQLVGNVLFPMTFPRELRGGEGAVTVRRQSSRAPPSIGHRRSRGPALEHCQLRDLGVEVDNVGRSAFRFPLGLAVSPRVVEIALDMLAGKGRQAEMRVALGMAAVPCAL